MILKLRRLKKNKVFFVGPVNSEDLNLFRHCTEGRNIITYDDDEYDKISDLFFVHGVTGIEVNG